MLSTCVAAAASDGAGLLARLLTEPRLRDELGIPQDALVLCWTSRIVREKRFDIFTDVVGRLLSEGFPVFALVAGVPSDESGAHMLEKFRNKVPQRAWVSRARGHRLPLVCTHSSPHSSRVYCRAVAGFQNKYPAFAPHE